MARRKGQMSNTITLEQLVPIGVTLLLLFMVVGIGAVVLGEFRGTTIQEYSVTGEPHKPDNNTDTGIGAGGVTVTVDQPRIKVTSETWTFSDTSADTNTTLTEGNNYTVISRSRGEYNFTKVDNYNSNEGDGLFADYSGDEQGNATNVVDSGLNSLINFANFFQVIVIVLVAVVIFGLLQMVRRAGRQSTV